MLHLAGEKVGHRFEATVGMRRESARITGRELGWPHLIEEQERVEIHQAGAREGPAQIDSVAILRPRRGEYF
jgi:hypothetical protein